MKTIARTMPRTEPRHAIHTLWDCCSARPAFLLDFDGANGQTVQYASCVRCAHLYAHQNGDHRVHPLADAERAQVTFTPVIECATCLPEEELFEVRYWVGNTIVTRDFFVRQEAIDFCDTLDRTTLVSYVIPGY